MAGVPESKLMMDLDAPAQCKKCGESFFVHRDHRAHFGVTTKYVCTKCGDTIRTRGVGDLEIAKQKAEEARLCLYQAEVKRDYCQTELEVEAKKLQVAQQQTTQAEIEARLKIELAVRQTAIEASKAEQEKQKTEQEKYKAECAKYTAELELEKQATMREKYVAEQEKQKTEQEKYKAKYALVLEQEKQATEREKYNAAVECARIMAEQKKQQIEWEMFKAKAKRLKEQEKQKMKQEKAECAKHEAEQVKRKSGHENNSWAACALGKDLPERVVAKCDAEVHTTNGMEKGTLIPCRKYSMAFKTI